MLSWHQHGSHSLAVSQPSSVWERHNAGAVSSHHYHTDGALVPGLERRELNLCQSKKPSIEIDARQGKLSDTHSQVEDGS